MRTTAAIALWLLCWRVEVQAAPEPEQAAQLVEAEVRQGLQRLRDPYDMRVHEMEALLDRLRAQSSHLPATLRGEIETNWCWSAFDLDQETARMAVEFASAGLKTALENEDVRSTADFLLCRAFYLPYLGQRQAAFDDIEAGIGYAESIDNQVLIADALSQRADLYTQEGRLAEALEGLQQALALYEKVGNRYWTRQMRIQIGDTLRRLGDYRGAMEYLLAEQGELRASGLIPELASVQLSVGMLFMQQENWTEAVDWFDRCIATMHALPELDDMHVGERYDASALLFKAEALTQLREPAAAQQALDTALALDPPKVPALKAQADLVQAAIHAGQNEHEKALPLARSSLQIIRDDDNPRILLFALDTMEDIHVQSADWLAAYQVMQEKEVLRLQLAEKLRRDHAARLQIEFQVGRREAEIERLREATQLRQQRVEALEVARSWQIGFVAVTGLIVLGLIYFSWKHIRRAKRFHILALTDVMTGLPNRRNVLTFAARVMHKSREKGQPCTFAVFDIDHFKRVNDTLGHDVGDVVISKVAELTLSTLRDHDRLGRTGGEEFLAVLPEVDLRDAKAIAERMRLVVERHDWEALGPGLSITISVGVATLEPTDQQLDTILKRADGALYRAKSAGRNCTRLAPPDDDG